MSEKQRAMENAQKTATSLRQTVRVWARIIDSRLKYFTWTSEQEARHKAEVERLKKEGKHVDPLTVGYVIAEFKP